MINWFRENKWKNGCIVLTAIALIFTVNTIVLYNKNNELKEEYIRKLTAEWYQLYRMTDFVDKYYIKFDFQEPEKFQLYVNQAAYNFNGRADDLSVNMRNLLVLAYDPLFKDLAKEEGPANAEEASTLLKEMNDEMLLISKSIIDLSDKEKQKILLNPKSPEFIKLSTEVKDDYNKYIKLVDDYFRNHS